MSISLFVVSQEYNIAPHTFITANDDRRLGVVLEILLQSQAMTTSWDVVFKRQ